ncbi:MAG TPA: GAF domain-containing protein [Actinoplanes sp.]
MTAGLFALARAGDRLADIVRLGLDREAERGYLQDIVSSVAVRLDTPFVIVDVLLNDAQILVADSGPVPDFIGEAGGTPLEWSFCLPLLAERAPRQVPDLTADPMFRDNPLVTLEGVRAYAGAPLLSHTGHVLGGLCGLDVRPRPFVPAELEFLREMAEEVVARLEEYAER